MKRKLRVLLVGVLLAAPLAFLAGPAAHAATTTSATVDPGTAYSHPFDGIGAISGGGGNTRLLYDYPDPERSDILDYLFKPGYGANLQILKIEIGGDTNSTDGAEHSFEHTRGVINCDAGYEMWIAQQAKARNPNIKIYGLAWGAPAWVGDGISNDGFYTPNAISYLTDWLTCAQNKGIAVDYLGGWNERYNGSTGNYTAVAIPWYQNLKSALTNAKLSTKVVAADDWWTVATDIKNNTGFASAVDVVGVHYPCGYLSAETTCNSTSDAMATGKALWASENGSQDLDTGAMPMARADNRDFLDGKMTATINWPVVAGIYPGLYFANDGLIHADQPWSGAYHVGASTWVTAQTTQFTAPGWLIDDNAQGAGSGYLGGSQSAGLGSYVSYMAPDKSNWSTVVETMDAPAGSTQTLNLSVASGLPSGNVHVYSTDLSDPRIVSPMTQQADISPNNGVYSIPLQARHVYTITTVTPPHTPSTASGPARNLLPLPYNDSLGGAPVGSEPAYLSDMNGAFESAACGAGRSGTCLTQVASGTPVCWTCNTFDDPYTMIGDRSWSDYIVAADVLLQHTGQVQLIGRAVAQGRNNAGLAGYHLFYSDAGAWSIQRCDLAGTFTSLASGTGPALGTNTAFHRLSLSLQGSSITAGIDGTVLGSVTDTIYASGPAGLGVGGIGDSMHGYYGAQFSNLAIAPGTPTTLAAGTYKLVNRNSTMAMDTQTGSDGVPLTIQNPQGGSTSQQWKITPLADGYYSIDNASNNQSLDVYRFSPTAGTQMELWSPNGGTNQEWSITARGYGYYTVESRSSGYLLDVSSNSTSAGAQVIQWPADNGTNQEWQLTKIG